MTLKEYLKKERLTPAKFSRLSGIPGPAIYRFLHNPDQPPRAETIRRIVEVTGGEVALFDIVPPAKIPPFRKAAR
jgi:predicted transcriptional regulator